MKNARPVRLVTTYPCCGGKAIFDATVEVPREQYDRTCPRCGRAWEIERMPMIDKPQLRADRLVWESTGHKIMVSALGAAEGR